MFRLDNTLSVLEMHRFPTHVQLFIYVLGSCKILIFLVHYYETKVFRYLKFCYYHFITIHSIGECVKSLPNT
jgi:hypothetical protein